MSQEIDKLAWIAIENRRLLATRTKGRDALYLPGGKREADESDEMALIREIKEELTVDLVPESIVYMETFRAPAHGKPPGTVVKMTCYRGDYGGDLQPDAEIAELCWIGRADRDRCSDAALLILDWLVAEGMVD